MTTELWQRVDRLALLEELRILSINKTERLLIVRGDDDSGRTTAGDLTESFLSELGFRAFRIREDPFEATTVQSLLIRAWSQMEGDMKATQMPRSLSMNHFKEKQILQEIAMLCNGLEKTAFIFDTVDAGTSIPLQHAKWFEELSHLAKCCVVVLSRLESKSKFPRTCRSLTVADMPVTEVRSSLLTSPPFATLPDSILTSLLLALADAAVDEVLCAQDAYELIQSHLEAEPW